MSGGSPKFIMLRLRKVFMVVACLLPLCAETARAVSSPLPPADCRVVRSLRLCGNSGWDYLALEPGGPRLFVGRDERVDVIDTASGKMAGTIPRTAEVHGIAFAAALKRGFISNGRSNSVTVFELDTLRVIEEVPLSGTAPDAVLYEPKHNHVFVANRESENLSVLDASTLQTVHTVPLSGPPEAMASDAAGHVYVNIASTPGQLALIDSKTLMVKAKWPLKECANPTALAIDARDHRLFSVCANQVMAVTDSVSGKAISRIVIGRGADGGGFDPDLGMVFSANGIDGTLTG